MVHSRTIREVVGHALHEVWGLVHELGHGRRIRVRREVTSGCTALLTSSTTLVATTDITMRPGTRPTCEANRLRILLFELLSGVHHAWVVETRVYL